MTLCLVEELVVQGREISQTFVQLLEHRESLLDAPSPPSEAPLETDDRLAIEASPVQVGALSEPLVDFFGDVLDRERGH